MNEFEDLIDMLQIEESDEHSDTITETICTTNDQGELICENISADNDTMTEWDVEVKEIKQEFLTMFDNLFLPIYNTFSIANALNQWDYIFPLEEGVEDDHRELEPYDDGVTEVAGVDLIDDLDDHGNVEQDIFMDQVDVSDFIEFVDTSAGDLVFLEDDVGTINHFQSWYFGPNHDEVFYYYDPEWEYDLYDGENEYRPYEEFAFGEVIRWQDQVYGALSFVLLALVLTKIVLFCTRSRYRRTNNQRTPLLTVTVEEQETVGGGDKGSYVPPKLDQVKKAVIVEKLEKEPHIVFI